MRGSKRLAGLYIVAIVCWFLVMAIAAAAGFFTVFCIMQVIAELEFAELVIGWACAGIGSFALVCGCFWIITRLVYYIFS